MSTSTESLIPFRWTVWLESDSGAGRAAPRLPCYDLDALRGMLEQYLKETRRRFEKCAWEKASGSLAGRWLPIPDQSPSCANRGLQAVLPDLATASLPWEMAELRPKQAGFNLGTLGRAGPAKIEHHREVARSCAG